MQARSGANDTEALYHKELLMGGEDAPLHTIDHTLAFLEPFVATMPPRQFFARLGKAAQGLVRQRIHQVWPDSDADQDASDDGIDGALAMATRHFRLVPFRHFLAGLSAREQGEIVKLALRMMAERFDPHALSCYLRAYAAFGLGKAVDGPETLDALMRELAASRYADFAAMVNNAAQEQRTIVFLSSRTDYKPLRLSIALRQKGYRTFFIGLDRQPPDIQDLFHREFDAAVILPFVPTLLKGLLESLHPQVFHVQCAMLYYYLGRMADEAKGDAICTAEFNDITSYFLSRDALNRFFGKPVVDLDWSCEAYACNHADIVLHQWAEGFADQWRIRHGGLTRVLEMQPHPVAAWLPEDSEPSSTNDLPRLVWAGQVPGRLSCPPDFNDGYYLGEAVEQLLEQGLAIDIFQNPMHIAQFKDPNLKFYGDLMDRFPLFRAMPGVRPDLLARKLAGYDFGLLLFDIDFDKSSATPEKNIFMLTNKLYTYIEAGLPILVNKEYPFMANFVETNGLGLTFYSHEIRNAGPRIRAFDRIACVERVRAYRARHMMEDEVDALIAAHDEAFRARGLGAPAMSRGAPS